MPSGANNAVMTGTDLIGAASLMDAASSNDAVSSIDAESPQVTGRRRDALDCLLDAAHPLAVADVARHTGLRLSTARFHLDGLVADGLAERTVEERATPGRRRVLYAGRPERSGPRSYGLLAEMLVGLVATVAPDAAVEAGRDWGRRLVRRPASTPAVDTDGPLAPLLRMLDDLGFRPEERTADGRPRLLLRHCPFREVATRHREVVCALHLGMMQGALADLDGPYGLDSLQPFVTPTVCLADLRPTAA
jgi:predicted ArsR family transcriptional regulator